jgi:Flp pilus assembly pilin Flp
MLRKLRKRNKGQSAVEYTVLFVVAVGAFLALQNYMKRGIQGRWRESIDDMGDQYDPQTSIVNIRNTLDSTTNTQILATKQGGGYWTKRTDKTKSKETRTGSIEVGAY